MSADFRDGIRQGLPIGLGYLFVSFGFGIFALASGLSGFEAVAVSFLNLTSAGQVAGISIIAASGSLLEIAFSQLVINLRYLLMGIALSQKLDDDFRLKQRLIACHGITDEIFALACSQKKPVTPALMYGITFIVVAGWTTGTLLGCLAGSVLPSVITDAMGILLYAMFIAIFLPPARHEKAVLLAVILAIAVNCLFYYHVSSLSSSLAVIISSLISAGLVSLIAPVKEEES
ncbi:MAG: AzlC family ABC transporter permease [Erysipelotrichaceae bacterium]|nr:AzlC family ABC transporter permease [Erysipelotrichaceae bacterium]